MSSTFQRPLAGPPGPMPIFFLVGLGGQQSVAPKKNEDFQQCAGSGVHWLSCSSSQLLLHLAERSRLGERKSGVPEFSVPLHLTILPLSHCAGLVETWTKRIRLAGAHVGDLLFHDRPCSKDHHHAHWFLSKSEEVRLTLELPLLFYKLVAQAVVAQARAAGKSMVPHVDYERPFTSKNMVQVSAGPTAAWRQGTSCVS